MLTNFSPDEILSYFVGFTTSLMIFYAADKLASLRRDVFRGGFSNGGDMVPRNRLNLDRIATRNFLNLIWLAVITLSVIAVVSPFSLVVSFPLAVSILLGFLSANELKTTLFQSIVVVNALVMGLANFLFQALS